VNNIDWAGFSTPELIEVIGATRLIQIPPVAELIKRTERNTMNITIEIGGPIVDAINNLAASLHTLGALEKAAAPAKATRKQKSQDTQSEVVENTDSSGSGQPSVMISAADAGAPFSPPSEATAPIPTHDEVKRLAALKSKKVGSTVIRGLIADTNFAQIADINDPAVLASLAAKLESL